MFSLSQRSRYLIIMALVFSTIAAISTVIASQNIVADSVGSVVIASSLLALISIAMFKLLQVVLSICNP